MSKFLILSRFAAATVGFFCIVIGAQGDPAQIGAALLLFAIFNEVQFPSSELNDRN